MQGGNHRQEENDVLTKPPPASATGLSSRNTAGGSVRPAASKHADATRRSLPATRPGRSGGGSPVTMAAATATCTRARAPRAAARVSPVPPVPTALHAPTPPGFATPRARPLAHAPRGRHAHAYSRARIPRSHSAPRAPRRGPSAEIGRRDAKPRIPPRSGARAPGKCSSGAALRGATERGGSAPRLPPGGFGARAAAARPPSAAPRPAVAQAGVFRRREAGARRTGERDGARRD